MWIEYKEGDVINMLNLAHVVHIETNNNAISFCESGIGGEMESVTLLRFKEDGAALKWYHSIKALIRQNRISIVEINDELLENPFEDDLATMN